MARGHSPSHSTLQRSRPTTGDIFSPVAFIAGLDRIFRMHDLQNPGVAVGVCESTTIMSKFEYAYDAALVDAETATARVTALAAGSIINAAMVISQAKSKVMHTARRTSAQRRRPRLKL